MEIMELIKSASEFSAWEDADSPDMKYRFNYYHYHPIHEIILVLAGKISITIDEKEYIAQAGNLVIIQSNEVHQIHIQEYPYKRIGLQIEMELLQKMLDLPESITFWMNESGNHLIEFEKKSEFIEIILRRICIEYNNSNFHSFEYIKSLINLFTLEIFRNQKYYKPAITDEILSTVFRVKNYIEKNYVTGITITQLSKKFFLSESYINRKFKELYGCTLKEYIILCQLNHSRELLINTNYTLKTIAEACGFNSSITFIRNFKGRFDCNPGEYRHKYMI